jgi:hypothetical protein
MRAVWLDETAPGTAFSNSYLKRVIFNQVDMSWPPETFTRLDSQMVEFAPLVRLQELTSSLLIIEQEVSTISNSGDKFSQPFRPTCQIFYDC